MERRRRGTVPRRRASTASGALVASAAPAAAVRRRPRASREEERDLVSATAEGAGTRAQLPWRLAKLLPPPVMTILTLQHPMLRGLVTGAAQAFTFNAYDRALYLSMTTKRSFLHLDNWRAPFQGWLQSVLQRTLSGGIFYPLEDAFKRGLRGFGAHVTLRDAIAGKCAGAVNGLLLNPIAVVKHHSWTSPGAGFAGTAASMFRERGAAAFLRGAWPTVLRDVAFGAVYTSLRHALRRRALASRRGEGSGAIAAGEPPRAAFACDVAAASVATIVSAPFNFARNAQYAASAHARVPGMVHQWSRLWAETVAQPTVHLRAKLLQRSLGVGWGSARVALGMAFGSLIYETLTRTHIRRRGRPVALRSKSEVREAA